MKVLVIGAGVVGLTTAYKLAKGGCRVTIVDKNEKPGFGASYANGGQLSYSYKTPIANMKVISQLPRILLGLDPAFKIYPTTDIDFYRWGLQFLKYCLPKYSSQSTSTMQKLGALSQKRTADLVIDTGIDFDYRKRAGKLYVYENFKDFQLSANNVETKNIWDAEKVYRDIPSLGMDNIEGGIFDAEEDAADSHKFCNRLLDYIQQKYDVKFLGDCTVTSISNQDTNVLSVVTSEGELTADNYILTAGAQSAQLCKTLGVKLPIYPMKGYSITVPANASAPRISVTDTARRMVYCRLGDRLRIAGIAEFSGKSPDVKEQRIQQLLENARSYLPQAGDYNTILDAWCGLRPATPDSLPIVSNTTYTNLFLNAGHGMLGWTYAAATADILSHLVFGKTPCFDVESLSVNRF